MPKNDHFHTLVGIA